MHISEGILSWQVLTAGGAVSLTGTVIGIKALDQEKVARTGILSAAFFVASLIHIPLGPGSVHLILNGLVGLLLGWAAFPAILVALMLQAIMFQFGGITTLGVNTLIMAVPAVVCYYLYNFFSGKQLIQSVAGFVAGVLAVFLSALLAAAVLVFSENSFREMAVLIVTAHVPVMIIEGLITGFAITFLKKVKPDLLK